MLGERKNYRFSTLRNMGAKPIKKLTRDFPCGPVVKNLPTNAGDMGSIPGWGTKISHAMGQLSPCASTSEPTFLGARVPN